MDLAFLDSGTGGLPYMQYLKGCCPEARCVYVADTKNFPYGSKTPGQIAAAASGAVGLVLSRWRPRAVVLACNTMSVTALPVLRGAFPGVPFVGTVPAIKLAASVSANRRIGLLATERTVSSPYTDNLVREFAPDCVVVRRADGRLVSFIEHELPLATRAHVRRAVLPAVGFFSARGVDTIVLGCTHFLHVADSIREAAGSGVSVIDSRGGVARQALRVAFEPGEGPGTESHVGAAAEPSDQTFFVTALSSPEEEAAYAEICRRAGVPWGGVIG